MTLSNGEHNLVYGPGYRRMFQRERLTLGVFFPIEAFAGDRPGMKNQMVLAGMAEEAGFAALWFRDVPLRDPAFGDVGHVFDPWVYLGYVTAHTHRIALATGSIILPLRHPIHTAKAAASVDQLSGGRLVLGIASGDRPVEYPSFGMALEQRGEAFREHLRLFDVLLSQEFPVIASNYGTIEGDVDLIPKPYAGAIPRLVTGNSRQEITWIARHSDGWITYPRSLARQVEVAAEWHRVVAEQCGRVFKPFAQALYIDLDNDPDAAATRIHLGFRLGRHALIQMLERLRGAGVNHVALNLKHGRRDAADVMDELANEVLPQFRLETTTETTP